MRKINITLNGVLSECERFKMICRRRSRCCFLQVFWQCKTLSYLGILWWTHDQPMFWISWAIASRISKITLLFSYPEQNCFYLFKMVECYKKIWLMSSEGSVTPWNHLLGSLYHFHISYRNLIKTIHFISCCKAFRQTTVRCHQMP